MIRLQLTRVFWLVLVGLVAGAGAWAYLIEHGRGSAPKYRTARVERGPLAAVVSASGPLAAVTTVQVGSQISGQVKQLFVDFNTPVRKGQVIAQLDPDVFEARVGQARAEVDSAQATVLNQQAQLERTRADVENAQAALAEAAAQTAKAQVTVFDSKRDLDRKNELLGRALIAKAERDTAQATYDSAVTQVAATRAKERALAASIRSAEAQVRVAEAMLQAVRAQVTQKQAALAQAMVDLGHTTIRAPVDGVVVSRSVDVGQTVAATLQAPTLYTIAQDLTQMRIEASVAEADIDRIKLDHRATFSIDAMPGRAFPGRVVQIRKAPQTVQNVVMYTVVIAVANPERRLLPGMTANVKVTVAERANVLKVPNAALRFRPSAADGESPPASAARLAGSADGAEPPSESTGKQLARELGLSDAQQAKLDQILQESRDQRRALRAAGLPEAERKARSRAIRDAARARTRDLLTPDQRTRYDQIPGRSREARITGRVWIPGPDGKPTPIVVSLGLSDGTATEILSGDLKEGEDVFVASGGPPTPANRPAGGGHREPRLRL